MAAVFVSANSLQQINIFHLSGDLCGPIVICFTGSTVKVDF
jgi:hypothetical protein